MKNKTYLILLFIITVAAILRFWNLSGVPISLDWDEASWGYNAYSIMQTGKDEYGKLFPFVLRSLDDYKPALYAYLEIPAITVFGLNDFSVRLPNAIFGIFGVLAAFFLVKELFKRNDLALLASFLLAISPWHIQFSRFAHEGIVGLTFNILMLLFFLKGLKKPQFLVLSAIFASLSLYSYQNEKLFVPLLGLSLLLIYFKELIKIPKKYVIFSFVVGAIISLPLVIFTFTTPESFTRAKGASFLRGTSPVLTQNHAIRIARDEESNDYIGQVLDNRRIVYARAVISNYLSHFDPNFLFIKGDIIPRHHPPRMGHLYAWEALFLLIGIYALVFGKFDRKIKALIFAWILITPIPAAFTWDVPNAGRTMNFLPTFQILTALGLIISYKFILGIRKNYLRHVFVSLVILFGSINFIYYLNQYFVQYNYFDSKNWQYGYDELIPEVKKLYNEYDKVIVSTKIPLDQSYIFFLYHLQYPPEKYQKLTSTGRYNSHHKFDKYEFREFGWKDGSNILYIGGASEFPSEAKDRAIKTINFLDGDEAFKIVEGR